MKNLFKIVLIILAILVSDNNSYCHTLSASVGGDSLKSLDASMRPMIEQTFNELNVPGAIIGIWINGYQPWKTTLGVSDLKTRQPISVNDKMRIGSITKTFTGTVLLQLVDEGKIKLDDKLSKYFPDFPNGKNITIDELGNMTSGIYNYSESDSFGNLIMKDPLKAFTPMELVDLAMKGKPYFAPGKGFHYSNSNTILLGLIIERITGNSLQSEIQNRILNQLGMSETTFELNQTFPEPHSQGYIYMDSLSMKPDNITNLNPSWGWSAGAMISTLEDLSKYVQPLAAGLLISAKSQADREKWGEVFIPTSGAWKDKPLKYGFALGDFDGAYGHNGGIPGFNSFIGYIPEKDATIIVLVNMQDDQKGIGPADYLARKIVEKIKLL